jgi:hypothetical protein
MPAERSDRRRTAAWAAPAVPGRQRVERGHLERAGRSQLRRLHRLHQQRRRSQAASGLRRRSLARKRRHLRHAVCDRRRQRGAASRYLSVLGRERRRRLFDRAGRSVLPIPAEAITQPHWIEGGAPGNVDQRSQADRHLLLIDCTHNYLYELYNVFYSTTQGQWLAGSGARLRLKTSVNGQDPALRTSDPNVQKIFRAMQKHGLIVADNGTDMYIMGTFDTRWNNAILNPAFSLLSASDVDVIQLGWQASTSGPALASLAARPNPVIGGTPATGTVILTGAAGTNGRGGNAVERH